MDDAITLTTLDGEFGYRVVPTEIVEPNDVRVLFPTKTETLTLVTCYPFNFVGPAPAVPSEKIAAATEGHLTRPLGMRRARQHRSEVAPEGAKNL